MRVIVVWMQVLEWANVPPREFEATVLVTGACRGTLVGMEA